MNIGYHNPPGATVGLNFMHLWTKWAFEFGIGSVSSKDSEDWNSKEDKDQGKTTTYSVGGDLNLKYLFGSGGLRPYLQGGVGAAVSTTDEGSTSAGTSVSRPFGGVGFFAMGSGVYCYASWLFMNASTIQAGIGINF